jgi:hypothetical protein
MSNTSNSSLTHSAHLALEMYSLSNDFGWNESPAHGFHVSNAGEIQSAEIAPDSYEVLALLAQRPLPEDINAIGLHTTGWASPISDIPASDHPERQRVQLIVVVDRTLKVVSVAQIEDSSDILVSEDGEGPVTDALVAAMAMSIRRALTKGTDESQG